MAIIKRIVLAGFLSILPVFIMSGSGTPAEAGASSASAGPAEIYAAHCAKCHGADGRAKTAKGKRVNATDFTSDWNRDPARGVRIITNGKGEMPSFKSKLSAGEIRSVFNYVARF